jgi:sulfur-oxidizing protein SoxX
MPSRLPFPAVALAALAFVAPALAASPPPAFVQRDKGHCIACHQVPEGAGPATRADVGPKLTGPRMRELGRARLRELVEDPTRANPDTVMPPFARHRILDPAEITRIVDYLHALP